MGIDDDVKMVLAARRFYLDDRTRIEIAEELGITRFRVAKLLDDARERGLVTITVSDPGAVNAELSERLRSTFGLQRVLAVQTANEENRVVRESLGRVAAELLESIVVETDVLGLSAGRTLITMSHFLTRLSSAEIVQMTGMAGEMGETAGDVVRSVSQLSGALARPIYAPLLVSDAETAQSLRSQEEISSVFARFGEITKGVVAIGSWDPPESQLYNNLQPVERERLAGLGARAEVCASLYTADGSRLDELGERTLTISLAQLRRIPEVIAVAGGPRKTAAIRAVLDAGFITTLITDAMTAERLLARS
ncbi:transcriptional regulator [Rathayibacter sp. ZW T2_19]|uniref:Transcriptional regulator n=1 Tax=Rathayibacter rubneri TaxID=2950106 RepID=A0A9X2IS86_9MICO|nr:sugar-binding domain-containing protein [Rathayibacter rubneri]MCM6761248.1 transcriptional regulator [Rathayibacter rubneri]